MPRPTASPAWQALQNHRQQIAGTTLADFFASDGNRAARLSLEAAGLFYDYSKQPVVPETIDLLLQLAADAGLENQIEALFAGAELNHTEGRAARHTALRAGDDAPAEVKAELARIERFTEAVRSGEWLGATGQPILDVVNLGVGGSDLGPRMVCHALQAQADGPQVHFVANADGPELAATLQNLDPATTMFIVVSKSFGTAETRINTNAALAWFGEQIVEEGAVARHFVTVSAKADAPAELGLPTENGFAIWDWVGGRFSLWSAVGLSIALSLGMSTFRELLAGAHAMDEHFRSSKLRDNLPVLLALVGIWQRNFQGIGQRVVLPYSHCLEHLPAYLQQLEMESNGKRVDRDGKVVDYATGTSVWGQAGTNAQHAFLQWLQQGTGRIPVEFILPLEVAQQSPAEQRYMAANCLAQSAVLMHGYEPESGAIERKLPGNRPSATLLVPKLDARHLGALLALYEHKVFVQSVVWHINPFDQWGVERGKNMASGLIAELAKSQPDEHDGSTAMLLARILQSGSSS